MTQGGQALVVKVGDLECAIPVHHVAETMRSLAVEPMAGVPGFVRGVSIIRGEPVPVLDLKALLDGGGTATAHGRFVTVKVGDRHVAFEVDVVIGLRNLAPVELAALPPLLRDARRDHIEALGAQNAKLLVLLRAARLVPAEVWAALAARDAS